jgi:hypothetical protein
MFEEYSLELLHDEIYLYSFRPEYKTQVLGKILPILWENDFLSMTQHDNEISVFMSSKHLYLLDDLHFICKMNEPYRVLRLYQINHQIDELGVVAKFAETFKNMEIPILYINSFSNNYVLIPSKDLSKLDGLIEY